MSSLCSSDDAAGKRSFHIFTVFPQVQDWLLVCFQEKKDIERVAILNSCCSLHLQLQNY